MIERARSATLIIVFYLSEASADSQLRQPPVCPHSRTQQYFKAFPSRVRFVLKRFQAAFRDFICSTREPCPAAVNVANLTSLPSKPFRALIAMKRALAGPHSAHSQEPHGINNSLNASLP